jgi:hypothetical protein
MPANTVFSAGDLKTRKSASSKARRPCFMRANTDASYVESGETMLVDLKNGILTAPLWTKPLQKA